MKKIVIFLALLSFCFFGSGYFSKALAEEENNQLSQKAENLREKYLSLNDSSISLEKQIEEMLAMREVSKEIKKNQELSGNLVQLKIAFIEDQKDFPRIKADLMSRNYSMMSEESLIQEINFLQEATKAQKDFFISIGNIKNMLENMMIGTFYKKDAKSQRLQPNAAFF